MGSRSKSAKQLAMRRAELVHDLRLDLSERMRLHAVLEPRQLVAHLSRQHVDAQARDLADLDQAALEADRHADEAPREAALPPPPARRCRQRLRCAVAARSAPTRAAAPPIRPSSTRKRCARASGDGTVHGAKARSLGSALDADQHEVHHVRTGRARCEAARPRGEEAVGVVGVEARARVEPAAAPRASVPPSAKAPAASVGPSLPSVPAASSVTPGLARERERRRQRQLLRAAPAAARRARVTVGSPPASEERVARRAAPSRARARRAARRARAPRPRRLSLTMRASRPRAPASARAAASASRFVASSTVRDARERGIAGLRRVSGRSPRAPCSRCTRTAGGTAREQPRRSSTARASA